jgi:hypothetical protein
MWSHRNFRPKRKRHKTKQNCGNSTKGLLMEPDKLFSDIWNYVIYSKIHYLIILIFNRNLFLIYYNKLQTGYYDNEKLYIYLIIV